MTALAEIHNLDDLAIWTSGGNHAKPIVRWTATDADPSSSITAHRVRIYTASSGGVAAFDSGKIAGNPGFMECNYAMPNGTNGSSSRWWTIEVWDDLDESSGESSRTEFKVLWGQSIFEYTAAGLDTSDSWEFSAAPAPADTQSAFLFRTATGAGGTGTVGAWQGSIGGVTKRLYLQVLVRLSSDLNGTAASLTDMEFNYVAASQQPDHWVADPPDAWALDPATYRYGTRAYKFTVDDNTTDRVIYPFRQVDGDDIPVTPDTDYVFSCYVRCPELLGDEVRLEVLRAVGGGAYDRIGLGDALGDALNDGPGATSGTFNEATGESDYPEGWQRLHVRFHTDLSTTLVQPLVVYINGGTGNGDYGWVDAAQLEEGFVVSPWHPGYVSPAAIHDSYGGLFDAMNGGTFRLRSSTGDVADIDDLVSAALGGGGGGSPNLDGGLASSTYGGITALNAGGA